jgi:hypothetical protein
MKTLKNKLKKGFLAGTLFLNGCGAYVLYDMNYQLKQKERAEDLKRH